MRLLTSTAVKLMLAPIAAVEAAGKWRRLGDSLERTRAVLFELQEDTRYDWGRQNQLRDLFWIVLLAPKATVKRLKQAIAGAAQGH
jgi:hypothetical protein